MVMDRLQLVCQACSLFLKVLPMFTNCACLAHKELKLKDMFSPVEHNLDCVGVFSGEISVMTGRSLVNTGMYFNE